MAAPERRCSVVYEPGVHSDLLMLDWWKHLATTGDLEKLFSKEMAECGTFMATMQRLFVVYEADDKGIWFAAWFIPFMDGANYGGWLRTDCEDTPAGSRAVVDSIAVGLNRFPVLLSITKYEPDFVQWLVSLGFEYAGTVPQLCQREDMIVAWLTEENFYRAAAVNFKALYVEVQEGDSDGR
jgi:hypothetical protein